MIPPVAAGRQRLVVVTARCALVLDPCPYPEHLEHPRGRPAKENDGENDNDEHSRAQRFRVVTFEAGCEGNTDRTAQTGPKDHHLICVREFFAALTTRMALEEVDQLGEWEDSSIARKDHRDGCDRDKKGFHVRRHFLPRWWRGEKRHAKIDEDEIFRELREGAEDVFGCTLRATGHSVVSIMFERDATEEKRHDARHGQAIGEKVTGVRAQRHQARFDGGVYSEGRVLKDQ